MGDVSICRQSCKANVNKVKSTKSSMPVYIFSKSRVGRIGVFAGRFWAPGLKFVTLAVEQYTCGISILTLTLACTAGSDSLLMENFEAEKKTETGGAGFPLSGIGYSWQSRGCSAPPFCELQADAGAHCSHSAVHPAADCSLLTPRLPALPWQVDTYRSTRGRDHVSIISSIF